MYSNVKTLKRLVACASFERISSVELKLNLLVLSSLNGNGDTLLYSRVRINDGTRNLSVLIGLRMCFLLDDVKLLVYRV